MSTNTMDIYKESQFYDILKKKLLYPVYQPIVSLKNGQILGYEGLTRIDIDKPLMTIEQLFKIAKRLNRLWELEELCRIQSIKNAEKHLNGKKLFLNVDPNIMNDEEFKSGVTFQYIEEYNLKAHDIIFEITEQSSVEDLMLFKETTKHYKNQGFYIAIDDMGSAYSNLNRICSIVPQYLKLDMEIVRDINKDKVKAAIVKGIVNFCQELNIDLIAEGIETQDELLTLIEIGVNYGQGYYLQRPSSTFEPLSSDLINLIKKNNATSTYVPSFFGDVNNICKKRNPISPDMRCDKVYTLFNENHNITQLCIVNSDNMVEGIITRREIMEQMGGRYGYDLNSKRPIKELMRKRYLCADFETSIDIVSKMALARSTETLYDAIIITKEEEYLGMVTVKDLLEAAMTIQVKTAANSNPLTGLPGNLIIESEVKKRISRDNKFSVIYIDLDNFKAYNDAYGFNNGDLMIQTLADEIKKNCINGEIKGHIGGDDFVIIADYWEVRSLCLSIISAFSISVKKLYSESDKENGYIISKNRNGFTDKFPLSTLSIAVINNKKKHYTDIACFSKDIAAIKKKSKMELGNSLIIS